MLFYITPTFEDLVFSSKSFISILSQHILFEKYFYNTNLFLMLILTRKMILIFVQTF